MIKVLLVSTNGDEAGVPRHVESIIHLLKKEVDFSCIFGDYGPVSNRLIEELGEKVSILKGIKSSLNFLKDFFIFFKFCYLVFKINPDLIHCHSAKAGIYGRVLSIITRKKVLLTIHGWPWRGFSGWKFKLIVLVEKLLMKFSRCSYIGVANCLMREASKEGLKISKKNFSVIYNSSNLKNSQLPIKGFINKDYKYFLMPARVSNSKDHLTLAKAFDLSNFKGKLIFAGEGTKSVNFKNFINSSMQNKKDDLIFLGQRSDIYSLMHKAEFIALCSNFETFPLIIPEAGSISKPLILSKVGGNQEILKNRHDALFASTLSEWIEAINFYCKPHNLKKVSDNLALTYEAKLSPRNAKKALLFTYSKIKNLK
ncbi:MAG: glycosyltransferase [Gammaproteobacteria bacterium]|nr:MAG: glycosyltransferase [Gammaproteobacteria bacterium]